LDLVWVQKNDSVFVAAQDIESLPIEASNSTYPTRMPHKLKVVLVQLLGNKVETDSVRETHQCRIRG